MAAGCGGLRASLALVLALLVAGCAGEQRRGPPPTYAVRPGDTLYSIAWRNRLDFHDLARWNGLASDYRIEVGQVLRLTPGGPAAAARPRAEPPARLPVTAPPHWAWPADGVLLGSVEMPSGGVGLRIGGASGGAVRAAAAGRVVYKGAGLRAYGQLVIIKHDDTWLSAYGYNREVLVAEGESVREGQPIATMGEGPGNRPMLYFEIRRNGRPVDPRSQLPPRG